ncbi:hypothetical protein GALMADRAFT_69778 [Galerina marginata CBS 339.88]|uniref:Uncharacterized protein n=1 Tax=Galerina marginata (strain CBS 339.88) TaxID=685588 RepID=A0A067SYZ4_GALM3|nr:hypothetical protein GALMADRAFT_69778 [Galerina marginata CBS 339.88]
MSVFGVTRPSQHASASSPSVSLERGGYRMRAPNSRPPPLLLQGHGQPQSSSHRYTQHHMNRNLVLLLLLLAMACMTCFGSAYYLFTNRWDF